MITASVCTNTESIVNTFTNGNHIDKQIIKDAMLASIESWRDNDAFEDSGVPYSREELLYLLTDNIAMSSTTSICVFYTIEWALILSYMGYKNITVVTDRYDQGIGGLSDMFGFEYIDNILEKDLNMKFDVIVGNPPYNKGLSDIKITNSKAKSYPHLQFIDKCIPLLRDENSKLSFIIPASFMTLSSLKTYRTDLLTRANIERIDILDNSKKQYFDINKFDNIAVITCSAGKHNNVTHMTREMLGLEKQSTYCDLAQYDYWPMYNNQISKNILDKVTSSITTELGYRPSSSTPHYVSFAIMGDAISADHTKHWLLNQYSPTVKCPGEVYFNSSQEAELHYTFYKSKLFNFVYNLVKSTPKNQPQFITYIGGIHNFHDTDYYKHFNLTKEEIDYIEQIIT